MGKDDADLQAMKPVLVSDEGEPSEGAVSVTLMYKLGVPRNVMLLNVNGPPTPGCAMVNCVAVVE